MPSPLRQAVCWWCGASWVTRSPTARTCNPTCRARLREVEHGPTRGRSPRDYPPELVEQIRSLYEGGMTKAEVQAAIGRGVKIENVIRRYGIKTRPAIARPHKRLVGSRNPGWKGDSAGYQALHLRVEQLRGKPSHCVTCGTNDQDLRYEWANLTGDYANPVDYQRMCVGCHRRYDAGRRARSGARTSPARR